MAIPLSNLLYKDNITQTEIERMSLDINKATKIEYKKVPVGTSIAMPVDVIDCGYQFKTEWPSGEKVISERTGEPVLNQHVVVNFEFPEHTDEFDGVQKPLYLGKTYTLSVRDDETSYVHEKSGLMQLILATNPDAKVLTDMLGVPCNVTVDLTENKNPKITAVTAAPAKFAIGDDLVKKEDLKLFNESKIYSMTDGKSDVYEALPEWIKEKIDNQANDAQPKF